MDRFDAAAACPIADTLAVIGDRWSLLIVRDALNGARRFGAFQEHLGIARNLLTERLRRLVDAGILSRVPDRAGSRYFEYVLTEQGRALRPVLTALQRWGEMRLLAADGAQRSIEKRAAAERAERDQA